jgi:hypothetical protein
MYMPLRGPETISAYAWPSTGSIFSPLRSSMSDRSAVGLSVVVPLLPVSGVLAGMWKPTTSRSLPVP